MSSHIWDLLKISCIGGWVVACVHWGADDVGPGEWQGIAAIVAAISGGLFAEARHRRRDEERIEKLSGLLERSRGAIVEAASSARLPDDSVRAIDEALGKTSSDPDHGH